MRTFLFAVVSMAGCSSASWSDTFTGVDSRSVADAGITNDVDETGASPDQCTGLAASKPPVSPVTVTFPGYGTAAPTIHVVAPTGTCDMVVDTAGDNILFVSDASPCATLLAPGTPAQPTATATGPDQLLFQWAYGSGFCEVDDAYALSKK